MRLERRCGTAEIIDSLRVLEFGSREKSKEEYQPFNACLALCNQRIDTYVSGSGRNQSAFAKPALYKQQRARLKRGSKRGKDRGALAK